MGGAAGVGTRVLRCASASVLAAATACGPSGSGTARSSPGTVAIAGQAGPNITADVYEDVAATEVRLEATEAQIWPLLRPAFEELGIEVTEVVQRQLIMGNPRFRARRVGGERLSTYIECGRDHAGPYADQHEVWLTLMVQLLRHPEGGTNVATLVRATARPRNVTGTALPCRTRGTLEAKLLGLISERLAGTG